MASLVRAGESGDSLQGPKYFLVASKRPNRLWDTTNFQLNGIMGVLSSALKATTTRS